MRFTVVNGENISGSGLTRQQAESLFAAGADVVTLGNHTFGKPQIATYLDEERYILRPANFTGRAPGHGCQLIDCGAFTVAVLVLPFLLLPLVDVQGAWLALLALPLAALLMWRFVRQAPARGHNQLLARTAHLQLVFALLWSAGLWWAP